MKSGLKLENGDEILYVSEDGTDLRIQEPKSYERKWYSHKFKSAGLRYEIGISVTSGQIVWVHGPFPAGEYNDRGIFNLKMLSYLSDNGKVLGDLVYKGSKVVHGMIRNDENNKQARNLRAYDEQVNGKIKSFSSNTQKWRHPLTKHHYCFFAVASIVQITIWTSNIV